MRTGAPNTGARKKAVGWHMKRKTGALVTKGTGRTASRTRDLVSDLRQLGFTEYEAKTYLSLLEIYPATAYEVARATGLPRANIYGAFDSLVQKGAVQPISESPIRYAPIDPKVTFKSIARSTSDLCSDVTARLTAIDPSRTRDYVWHLAGAENVHAKISEVIATAERHIWIKAHERALARHIDELKAAARRGIRLLIILFGHEPGHRLELGSQAEIYLLEGTGVVLGLSQSLITVTTDFRVALTADLEGEAYGALTQSKPVVNLAESVIRHEVYLADIFAHFGKSITDDFGFLIQRLRRKYMPRDQIKDSEFDLKKIVKAGDLSPAKRDLIIRKR
jgi:sugar-specific transcriptional regulator TrmB